MKLKYPKTITIGSTTFNIKYDVNFDGASLDYPTKTKKGIIVIGTKFKHTSPYTVLEYIIHEIKEIIQIEQGSRLWNRSTDAYEFHYTHKEHSDFCARLAGALQKFIE